MVIMCTTYCYIKKSSALCRHSAFVISSDNDEAIFFPLQRINPLKPTGYVMHQQV